MNRHILLFNLREALEELQQTLEKIANDPDYSKEEFRVALGHLYHHVNTSRNARNATDSDWKDQTDQQFLEWRAFPKDIDLA